MAGLAVLAGCGGGSDGPNSAESDDDGAISAAVSPSTTERIDGITTEATAATLSIPASSTAKSDGTATSDGAVKSDSTGATSSGQPVSTTSPSTSTPSTAPQTTAATAPSTTGASGGGSAVEQPGSPQRVRLRFESQVDDIPVDQLRTEALAILNDPRGWVRAGFTFVSDDAGPYRVVLAEGDAVDRLCLPLQTYGSVSCQNGPVVALNADRWRTAVDHWVLGVEVYRGYLVNHEVGHLIGQRHPKPRCPVPGRPAGVMEQQTAGLEGCVGNPWPREWELDHARRRPVVYAPLPDWGPDPVPANGES